MVNKEKLDQLVELYNHTDFIDNDPISIPHQYSKKEDIEISGFLTSIIAWGRRPNILKSANQWMDYMDKSPYDFLCNASEKDLLPFEKFIYRTFQGEDCIFFVHRLRQLYAEGQTLEKVFTTHYQNNNQIKEAISGFREVFLEAPHLKRSEKHLANPMSGSAAKRINMFLRWMVRKDNKGVDFGLWDGISPADLVCPLDVHSGRIAREMGLLDRKQNNWLAAEELTVNLRKLDAEDPCKYDFALFGYGVNQ